MASKPLLYAVLVTAACVSFLPFLIMLTGSLKTFGSVITNNLWPWPPLGTEALQWENYPEAVRTVGWDEQWGTWLLARQFANSAIVSAVVVGGALVTSVLAAWALARVRLPGAPVLFLFVLATVMVPDDLTLVPRVVMMFNFGWYNTYLALTVPFLASVFGIFLLRQFFLQIPRELFDAAAIDGAGHLRTLFAIALPLARPALVTVALLNFVWTWDSFRWPLLVTRDANMRVLAVGLQQFIVGEGGVNLHLLMAFATIVAAPIVVAYFFTQKYFREGVITSGLRG